MKRYLPAAGFTFWQSKKANQELKSKNTGFTLVELLVVISIIAILSVIGVTIFTGAQKAARDARRKGDIDSIAKALEINKGSSTYTGLDNNQFSSGSIPKETDTTTEKYCINVSTSVCTTPVATASAWATGNACPTTPTGYSTIAATGGSGAYCWAVCARMESSGAPLAYCRQSAQ